MKVVKFVTGKYEYWRFSFTNTRKQPKKRFFTFSCEKYSKKDVEVLAFDYQQAQKNGWDPWSEKSPKDFLDGDYQSADTVFILLEELKDSYLDSAKHRLNANTHTVYSGYLQDLINNLGNPYIHTILSKDVEQWVNGNGTWHTRRTRKIIFNQMWKFAQSKHWVKNMEVIAQGTKVEKSRKRKSYLNLRQMRLLLEQVKVHATKQQINKHSKYSPSVVHRQEIMTDLIQVLFYQGLRINEALNMKPEWISEDLRFLTVGDNEHWPTKTFIPKSGKVDDPIPIPNEIKDIYRKRLSRTKPYEKMFPISVRRFQKNFKEYLRAIFPPEIAETNSPHTLRDSCASYWLNERSVPVEHVQKMLRHAKIQTTLQYIHYDREATYDRFNQ